MKTINVAAATLGAALLIAGSPVVASAALQASPVRLDNVSIQQSYGVHNNFAYTGLVSVAFTNETAIPVTKIVFDVESQNGNVIARINDVGNYAQGVTVKHSFPDIQTNNGQQLAVESVTFADGSSWSNTDTVAPRRQAAQSTVKAESAEELFPLFPYETE
jgi:hypothetical protein